VMTVLQADATLATAAPGGVHRHVAPESVAEPFVIVSPQINTPTNQFGGEAYEVARIQVKAVANSTSGSGAQTAADRIDVLLNHATLAITGYAQMLSERVETFEYIERDGDHRWQHRGADYQVWGDPA
jgi:predicted esterase YcpF (UPF0227 family)